MRTIPWRWVVVAVSITACATVLCGIVYWYAFRTMLGHEAAYNDENRRLYREFEVRLREQIDVLLLHQTNELAGREAIDRIFELLRTSRVANNSREVDTWRSAPHSPQRRSIALKWAKVAADEAAYMAALGDRWAVDYEQGRMPHHISGNEVPPYDMPPGWTEDDLKY